MYPGDRSEWSLLSRKSVVGVRELVGRIALFCIVTRTVARITSLFTYRAKTTTPDKGGLEILGMNPLDKSP